MAKDDIKLNEDDQGKEEGLLQHKKFSTIHHREKTRNERKLKTISNCMNQLEENISKLSNIDLI